MCTSSDHYGFEDKQRRDRSLTTDDLEKRADKGPLLTTALALFGPDSWLDLAMRYPDLYSHKNRTSINCVEFAPLGRILSETTGSLAHYTTSYYGGKNGCISDSMPHEYEKGSTKELYNAKLIGKWLYNFRVLDGKKDVDTMMAYAFTIAAYLSNMAWISEGGPQHQGRYLVYYDLGADSQKPSISLAGIIVVSAIMGLDLLGLLATAIYASWFPRWTELLDAFSMLRLGSSISAHVPLKVSVNDDEVQVLDELPGWVGSDSNGPGGKQGEHAIELGGPGRLQKKTAYEAYDGKTARKRARKSELKWKKRQKWEQIFSV